MRNGSIGWSAPSSWRILAALLILVGSMAVPVAAQAADDSAAMTIDKTTSVSTLQPGQELPYQVTIGCSSLTDPGCVDMTVTDTLPAEFEVTSLPPSNAERDVSYDPVTRVLTVQYKIDLGDGTFGIPAGAARQFTIAMRLPTQTPVLDGAVITNTASVDSVNALEQTSSVPVTVDVPLVVRPVNTKSWADGSLVAGSQGTTSVTLGIRNGSSSNAEVKELVVTDDTDTTFDAFNVTQLGPVTTWPTGTDQVVVGVCTKPIGSPCVGGEWIENAPTMGSGPFATPGGVALDSITGVRFTFSDSGGADLPFSADEGFVDVGLQLRDDYRDSGLPIQPPNKIKVENCAAPTAVVSGGGETEGQTDCDSIDILPDVIVVIPNKSIFPDQNGDYKSDGHIVVGQDSGVSMKMTGRNDSPFKISELVIEEPSQSSPSDFSKLDITNGRYTWPAGANDAVLSVTCRSGPNPADQTWTNPPSSGQVTISNFGCQGGAFPEKITMTFSGTDGSGDPTIKSGATAKLDLHGTAPRVDAQNVSDGLLNCFDVIGRTTAGGSTTGSATGCANTTVANPTPGVGGTTKNTGGVSSIVPGQPLQFNLSFRNTGNVPLDNIVLLDPNDPTASPNEPFDAVRLTQLRALTSAPASDLEVYDPTASAYVPYDAQNAALLARAKGIRISLTEPLKVGQRFRAEYQVLVRDGVPPGTMFKNCFVVYLDGAPAPEKCSGDIEVLPIPTNASASLQKLIAPSSVIRPTAGLPAQTVQVKHLLQNNGPLYLARLQMTDVDQDFFDAVTFADNIHINYPPGANRVQVDACVSVSDCNGGTWQLGNVVSGKSPSLPAGVVASSVKGLRVTFSRSGGGYDILPGTNYPGSGPCKGASVCFDAVVRETLASNGDPIPDPVSDTSSGAGESVLQPPGELFQIPEVTADLTVNAGTPELDIVKDPDSRIGPGESAPFTITIENTGTSPVTNPVIVEPVPDDLTIDPTIPGGSLSDPYTVKIVSLPAGYPPPSAPVYTEVKGDIMDPNKITEMSWLFDNFQLPPGGKLQIGIQVVLSPGVLQDTVITNTAGTSGTDPGLTCRGTDQPTPPYDPYCIDSATVTSLPGNNLLAEKWDAGD
ncbi:MAG: DUF11 domain-containing protein, partial [Actinomycetia bacterium]|nr:DUF11 domain-containing protein [Actinomycetes bacterium]